MRITIPYQYSYSFLLTSSTTAVTSNPHTSPLEYLVRVAYNNTNSKIIVIQNLNKIMTIIMSVRRITRISIIGIAIK